MNISTLKAKTSSPDVRLIINILWDCQCQSAWPESPYIFREVILQSDDSETLEEVFRKLSAKLFAHPGMCERKKLMKHFRDLSSEILGSPIAFAEGTEYEKRYLQRKEVSDKQNALEFLREVFEIKPSTQGKVGFITAIIKADLYDAFVENKDVILKNNMVAYEIASTHIVPLIGTAQFTIYHQVVMSELSSMIFGDRTYWITANEIDTTHLFGQFDKNDILEEETELDEGLKVVVLKTGNNTIRRQLKYLWGYNVNSEPQEEPNFIFRDVIQDSRFYESTNDVMKNLISTFHSYPELYEDKNLVNIFMYFSNQLYGNGAEFAKGTALEELCQRMHEERAERKRKMKNLTFLSRAFGMSVKQLNELQIPDRIINTELYPLFMENKDRIVRNGKLALDVAASYIVPLIGTSEYKRKHQKIMNILSVVLFDDAKYWKRVYGVYSARLFDEEDASAEN